MAFKTIRKVNPIPATREELQKVSERGYTPLRGVDRIKVEFTELGKQKVPFVIISSYEFDGDIGLFAEVKTNVGWIALRSFLSKYVTDYTNPNDIKIIGAEGLCPADTPLDKVYDAIAEKGEGYEFSVVTLNYMAKSSKNGNIFSSAVRVLR